MADLPSARRRSGVRLQRPQRRQAPMASSSTPRRVSAGWRLVGGDERTGACDRVCCRHLRRVAQSVRGFPAIPHARAAGAWPIH
eukprot:2840492-Prymnesium_polylepis.1